LLLPFLFGCHPQGGSAVVVAVVLAVAIAVACSFFDHQNPQSS
jgi:hypothetical protein